MFRIKVCGMTSSEDAAQVASAGADAVGLNFCRSSPRYLDVDRARRIVAVLPRAVARVGVFVNAPADMVRTTEHQLQLDWVQLHGDEPPDYLPRLGDRAVIKVFRCGQDGVGAAAQYLHECRRQGRSPRAVLIDAHVPDQYGGTGRVVDWELLAGDRSWTRGLPLILAGGLTPENVPAAVATVRPDAVDTASGVESAPGKKDALRVDQFVRAAIAAFDRVGQPPPAGPTG